MEVSLNSSQILRWCVAVCVVSKLETCVRLTFQIGGYDALEHFPRNV